MHNKENDNSSKQTLNLLMLILVIIGLILSYFADQSEIHKNILKLEQQIGFPILLILQSILLFLSVLFAFKILLKLYKKPKNESTKFDEKQKSTIPVKPKCSNITATEKELIKVIKLSKEEMQLLLLFKGNKKLLEKDIFELSQFSFDKTKVYFEKLKSNDFIEIFPETQPELVVAYMYGKFRYFLSQKGREYLYDNNLLD